LKGLEVSEVFKSELERTKRIDSEFYKKENLQIINFLKQKTLKNLTEVVHISDGNHMSISEEFIDKGIPYYRGQDIHNFFIENASPVCIPEKIYDAPVLQRSHLIKNDILLSIVGTIGKIALVTTNDKATCSCKLAILRPKNSISSELLAIFLISKYGQNQIQKFIRGAVQMGLILEDMDQLFIPIFTTEFDSQISKKVQSSKEYANKSQSLYRRAEELLLETIGLSNFKLSSKATNIKSFKNSFFKTGRLDAEYYQPKYEELINKVKKQPYSLMSDLIIIKKSIEPGSDVYSDQGLPFIRVSDYDKFGIYKPEKCLSNSFYKENASLLECLYPKKETILFSKDGSVGTAYMMCENMQAVTSGAILHLTIKNKAKVLPEYLTLVLNSEVVKKQAERDVGGSIILHWRINEIEKVVIPIVSMRIQRQIVNLIDESFTLRRKSEELLGEAKTLVENEIEGEN
jgi:restriction endonuclease S subunit